MINKCLDKRPWQLHSLSLWERTNSSPIGGVSSSPTAATTSSLSSSSSISRFLRDPPVHRQVGAARVPPHVRFSADLDSRMGDLAEVLGSEAAEASGSSPATAAEAGGSSTPPPRATFKGCHHLMAEELKKGRGGVVLRTHSNPEMEYCPVCLARKECEILLKRTYSKVVRLTYE